MLPALLFAYLSAGLQINGHAVTLEPKAPEVLLIQGIVGAGGFLLGCSVHEGLHGTTSYIVGHPPKSYRLYPELEGSEPRYCSTHFETLPIGIENSLVLSAPYLFDASWLTLYSGVVLSGGSENLPLEVRGILAVFSTVFLIDFANGFRNLQSFKDVQRVFDETGTKPETQALIVNGAFVLAVVWAGVIVYEEASILTVVSKE